MESELDIAMMDNQPTQSKTPTQKLRWYESETKVVWFPNTIVLIALNITFLYYLIKFPYLEYKFLVIWAIFVAHISGIGITAGVHRLWAHRTFKAKLPLRILLATFYYVAGLNSISAWTRDHRAHHKYTDTDADPHNSRRGFWFSHCGWLMMRKNDKVVESGKKIDMSDVTEDPVVKFFDGHHYTMRILLSIALPIFIPVYFFNQDLKWAFVSQMYLRYPWILNAASSVNSFNHMFGYHTYDKSIRPTENIYVAFIAYGEGWHNYHHVFPWDYKASEFASLIFNATTLWIDMFAKIGWAYDLKTVSPEQIQSVVEKKGDGTHHTINHVSLFKKNKSS